MVRPAELTKISTAETPLPASATVPERVLLVLVVVPDTLWETVRVGAVVSTMRMEPVEMDAGITQFTLDVDGQLVKYAHGPVVPMAIQFRHRHTSRKGLLRPQRHRQPQ